MTSKQEGELVLAEDSKLESNFMVIRIFPLILHPKVCSAAVSKNLENRTFHVKVFFDWARQVVLISGGLLPVTVIKNNDVGRLWAESKIPFGLKVKILV